MKEGYESAEPQKSDPNKPWYEDRWYEKPLDLHFRNFDEEAEKSPGENIAAQRSDSTSTLMSYLDVGKSAR